MTIQQNIDSGVQFIASEGLAQSLDIINASGEARIHTGRAI